MNETKKVIGGIYINKEDTIETAQEFGVYIGNNQTTWFANDVEAYSFYDTVENGGMHNVKLVNGYSFGIHTQEEKKYWRIRDTGHKECKHIICKGPYVGYNFEKEVKQFIKQMTGF